MSQLVDGVSFILGILGNSFGALDIRKASHISTKITIYNNILWIHHLNTSICCLCKLQALQLFRHFQILEYGNIESLLEKTQPHVFLSKLLYLLSLPLI